MEEQNEITNEPNSSMEELKVEEENIKEVSLEDDILGTQSLLMSESDEDDGTDLNLKSNKNSQKKISPKRSKRIADSDEDLENGHPQFHFNSEENLKNKKKISALIDSDSDDGQTNFDIEKSEPIHNLQPTGEYDARTIRENIEKENKIAKSNSSLEKKTRKTKNSVKKLNKKKPKSEISSDIEDMKIGVKITKKGSSLVDTDSSNDESTADRCVSDLETPAEENNNLKSAEKKKTSKIVRASAKRAMDEMQAIQSEQQRLHREAHISIPYHKPRKHTLDEFLKRRTIIQPQNASPAAAVIQTRNLKMTTEELEEYAKLMEERAKEATEFFKSESENEEDKEVFKDNEGVLDNPVTTVQEDFADTYKQSHDLQNDIELDEKTKYENSKTDQLNENQNVVQLTEDDLKEILAQEEIAQLEEEQERPTCSKVLITEIIELPKLDMNTVRISPVKKHTPRSSLNVKQLLAEKVLPESPSLSGDPNKLIDLETGNLIEKESSGMDSLIKRLMTTIKAKKEKKSETCNILSVENGKLEISKVNVTRSEMNDPQKETKPGAAYFELKKNLKEIIKKKRLEEINKKQDDELEYNKCLADDDSEEEEEIQETFVEEYEPDEKPESKVVWVDEEENALLGQDNNENSGDEECAENGMENEEEDEEHEEDENIEHEEVADEDKQNNQSMEPVYKSQRKSRIITAFNDDSDEEGKNDDIDFLKTQPPTSQPALLETQTSVTTPFEDEENELMALCSGTFDDNKKHSAIALMSQIPITQNCEKPFNDDELMALCSGAFDKPPATQQRFAVEDITESTKIKYNKILSSDEENEEEPDNMDERKTQKVKKFTKRQKKKKAKLGFSDDEDDEEGDFKQDDEGDEELTDDNSGTANEEPETFIDYDSEENEIVVKMTKNDKVKEALNFFENEAELSESEWGSADEDENNIDKYDIELGDEDEFDREKIRTELGQIHARKMLDEDIREVRKIQELLFEDEEKDGVGRQRTFKWKNAESGFSLEDGRPIDEGENQNGDSGDEMSEHQWRKIRYEREQFLKEQGLKPNSQDMHTVLANTSIPLTYASPATVTSKKLQIITAKKTTISSSDAKRGSPFLISKGISTMHKKSVRGSFLVRDKETLHKLAGLTKGTSSSTVVSDMDNAAGTVSVKSVRATNFVFATLTNEEHENLKRKADDLLNSSNENGKDFMKKPKIEPRRDKCFIDQLL